MAELIHAGVENILLQVVPRGAGPLAVEPAVGQHPHTQHHDHTDGQPRIEAPAAAVDQQPETVPQQGESRLVAYDEEQTGHGTEQHAPRRLATFVPVPQPAHRQRRQQQHEVARQHLGAEVDVEIGHEPEAESRQQEPFAPGERQRVAHRAVEEEQHNDRQQGARQLQQRHGQPGRPDAHPDQRPAQAPRHKGLHAGAHLQGVFPGQMVGRGASEEVHAGILQDLEMFVRMVDAPAQEGVEQGHQTPRPDDLPDGDPAQAGKRHKRRVRLQK